MRSVHGLITFCINVNATTKCFFTQLIEYDFKNKKFCFEFPITYNEI